MISEKDKTQRRVYVLPTDLVNRIVTYQMEMGLASEVEAARRLLDEALMRRDDWRTITRRFLEKLGDTRVLSDIAKEVLIGHPLVSQVKLEPTKITFDLTTGETVSVQNNGGVDAMDNYQQQLELDPKPPTTGRDFGSKGGNFSRDLDDEIPF